MLPRPHRLSSASFERAFQNARTIRHPLLVLRVFGRNDAKPLRAAFVVPKKQGKAAQRNRTRRRIRERFRLRHDHKNPNLANYDLIFLTTPQTAAATNAQLDEALKSLLSRVRPKPQNGGPLPFEKAAESASSSAQTPTWPAQLALALIGFYQRFISPFTPPSCRFYPTCSCYTHAAIERYGLGRGLVMGAVRLGRCHPWHPGGDDPVPAHWEDWKRPVWWQLLTKFRGAAGVAP